MTLWGPSAPLWIGARKQLLPLPSGLPGEREVGRRQKKTQGQGLRHRHNPNQPNPGHNLTQARAKSEFGRLFKIKKKKRNLTMGSTATSRTMASHASQWPAKRRAPAMASQRPTAGQPIPKPANHGTQCLGRDIVCHGSGYRRFGPRLQKENGRRGPGVQPHCHPTAR